DGARSVAVDRAALEHPVGLGKGQAGAPRQPFADILVALEVVLAAPAVEAEALSAAILSAAEHDGAGIAQPDVAERLDDHLGERAQPPRGFGGPIMGGDQPHFLALAAS